MRDSYGDGWNGGKLEVFINGNSIGNYSAVNFGSVDSFQVCNGDALQLFYTAAEWENENTYQLYDPSWNLLFTDGPNPQTDSVFSSAGNCTITVVPGSNPCTAIPIDTGQCIIENNTGMQGSGLHPECAAYQGSDIWFSMQVPPSGNLSFLTDSGGLTDTGLAVWTDSTCTNLRLLGCDDDAGNGYYSFITLSDLTPYQTLYIQVWGYGGATGSFRLCVNDLGTVLLDSSELPIVMINTLGQTIIADTKVNCLMDIKYNGAGNITYVTDSSNVYSGNIGIEIRGASSSGFPQHPYGFETRDSTGANYDVSLLGMPAENDWVLISNFNDMSLIRNTLAYKLFGEMGHYSPRTSLCEVLIDSSYKGIYVFGEKVKRDSNRVNIAKLNLADTLGDELTGGYILQQNYWDVNNSFQSNYSPIDHPGFDVHFVYEYPEADVIAPAQKLYIASFVDSLEDALYGPDFADTSIGYRKYMSVKSFIDYFLVNELARNADGFKKSVFFNKDKYSKGGKLKAGPVWDFDFAWKNLYGCYICENTDGSGWAHYINDCFTDNYSTGWYLRLMQDSTYNNELRCRYENYRQTILDTTHIFAYIDSVRTLVQHAQARHFQKWPILGLSGPATEMGNIATTYNAGLDTLKEWIILRLQWLDENIPGRCTPIITNAAGLNTLAVLQCFPNPAKDKLSVEISDSGRPIDNGQVDLYNAFGRLVLTQHFSGNKTILDISGFASGIYFVKVFDGETIYYRKIVVD